MGEEFTRVEPRYTLKPTLAGSVASQRQLTRLPGPERTLMRPRLSRSSCLAPGIGVPGVVAGGVVGTVGTGSDGIGCVVEVGVVAPVQVTPLRTKLAGTGLLPVHDPLNPNEVLPPVGMAAL